MKLMKSGKYIKLLKNCLEWSEGYISTIQNEDNENYYFDNEWGYVSHIEKNKRGVEFKILRGKPNDNPTFICGGKDVTYNKLMKKASQLKKVS